MNFTSTTSPSRTTSKRASSRSPWSRNYRASSRMPSKSLAAKMRPCAKTRATIGVGPVKAEAGKACDIYDIKKREALIAEVLKTTKPTTKSSGRQAPKREVQDTRKRKNIRIRRANFETESLDGWECWMFSVRGTSQSWNRTRKGMHQSKRRAEV